jgi:uncharacterized membrane protein required for colicin V production
MTIWILAVLLLGALGFIGYRQGAIRVGCSLVGILFGALLAVPLGHVLQPLLKLAGMKNPVLAWLIAPLIAFVLISIIFKVIGLAVHKKAETYYKYNTDDGHRGLWERLNRRLGACVGLANGVVYLILISFVIYASSYWTVQMSGAESDPKIIQLANRLGRDSLGSGMARVARSIDKMPTAFYDSADIAGLIYHNPVLVNRVSHYPAFLTLGERQDFQDLGNDMEFNQAWQTQKSAAEISKNPRAQAILGNPETLHTIWNTLKPDLADFQQFLETGQSAKYDPEKILGRWLYDAPAAVALARKSKPALTPAEKRWLNVAFTKTSFVAAPDKQAFLKNIPRVKPGNPPTVESQAYHGQWESGSSKYTVTLNMDNKPQEMTATVQNDRLTLSGAGMELAFDREN